MAKYIFYILMGLFLLSKLTSAYSSDVEEYKRPHTITEAKYSLSEADVKQYKKVIYDENYNCQADTGNLGYSISSRCMSPSKNLRSNSSFIIAKIVRTLKVLLLEEKNISFSYSINPSKTSYRYYVYALRHILV